MPEINSNPRLVQKLQAALVAVDPVKRCSRKSKGVDKLAKHLGLSVHTVQSLALGRRGTCDKTWKRIETWCNRHG